MSDLTVSLYSPPAPSMKAMTSYVNLRIPEWNETLQAVAEKAGFHKTDWKERINILPFPDKKFEVRLPEGYSFADGETTPDFYLSNVHMAAFRYGISAVKEGERAFHDLRQMKPLSNRVMEWYPKCTGMLGGDQLFYEKTGYVTKTEVPVFAWEEKI